MDSVDKMVAKRIAKALIARAKGFFLSIGAAYCRMRYNNAVIVMVDGGLASQIFKFGFGEWLASRLGCTVYFDLAWYGDKGMDLLGQDARPFEVNTVFPLLNLVEPDAAMCSRLKRYCLYGNPQPHRPISLEQIKRPRYYDGYYSHASYFLSQEAHLRSLLVFGDSIKGSPRVIAWREKILRAKFPIAVHVRRGDYVASDHDVVGPEYFRTAIAGAVSIGRVAEEATLFFFTNDEGYVATTIISTIEGCPRAEIIPGDSMTGAEDMYLMSLCECFVISNSGFSWIPAWLNDRHGKSVFMPAKWFATASSLTAGSESAFFYPGVVRIDP
jgi:hypothetical protein